MIDKNIYIYRNLDSKKKKKKNPSYIITYYLYWYKISTDIQKKKNVLTGSSI